MSDRIELGDEARDTITGFEGVVIGITKWLHGCRRITLQPRALQDDGKVAEASTFDEPQLQLTHKAAAMTTGHTGGPTPEPTRPAVPPRY